jgi:hypothetical protein
MQASKRSMRARAILPLLMLLMAASLGSAVPCLTDCQQSCECDRTVRQSHSHCDPLQLSGRPECCLNEQSALPDTATRKLVAPRVWPNAAASSTFSAISISRRVAHTTLLADHVGVSQLFSLHCAFLI